MDLRQIHPAFNISEGIPRIATDIDLLARVLDRFYRSAPTGIGVNAFGQWSTVRRNCEENFSQTEEFAGNVLDRRKHQIIKSAMVKHGILHNPRAGDAIVIRNL